ncbi:MAG: hypothetical protein CVV64_03765 [Candidatus Wallbacteria bacterium HGW-Wallbacteria-1]|jgi:spore germination protein GerM|uniref:GerMN domain-containing protein n=1 Tax=Candidatus Wallbacteria bacterium HGW-Wallbacteria-1 TaxID=2013854 RepID=A0A2N1PTX1_9BACT|nr:MAG: hypothetical protein CVV64_03765 [Candidatus Wallbacteria bacterium HGW-Wallbacteria-1]
MTEEKKSVGWTGIVILLVLVSGLGFFVKEQFFSDSPFFPMVLDYKMSIDGEQQKANEITATSTGARTMTVSLFFVGPDLSEFEREDRSIPFEADPLLASSRALEELLRGPGEFGLYPLCGKDVTLRTLFVRKGTAYVDLSRSVADGSWRSAISEYVFLKAVCRTLSNMMPDINWIVFMVNGRQMSTMNREDGHLDIGNPFPADFRG